MKTTIKKEKHAELVRKFGKRRVKQPKELEEFTGIWKDRNVTLDEIRKKAWSRK